MARDLLRLDLGPGIRIDGIGSHDRLLGPFSSVEIFQDGWLRDTLPAASFARSYYDRADVPAGAYCYVGSGSRLAGDTTADWHAEVLRFGEAAHPGPVWLPQDSFALGTMNPSGIRGKEHQVLDLPAGIWTVAETHLSLPLTNTVLGTLRRTARACDRDCRFLVGAPVPLRTSSSLAGTWSGVMHIADCPSRSVQAQWPHGEFQLGRVALAQHWLGSLGVTGAAIYAWSPGPTWPGAKKLTNRLFETLTDVLIHSRQGCRYVSGDFNLTLDEIPIIEYWKSLGWKEVQELDWSMNGVPPRPTCKGTTQKDFVLVSPELAALFHSAEVLPVFADHAAVFGRFKLPSTSPSA